MKFKVAIITCILAIPVLAASQTSTEINITDQQGRKQGRWVRKYPNQNIMYEGVFKDNHPVGEFRRYNEDKSLKSILIYSADGKNADATIYHSNGSIFAQGKYVNQMKEGKWKFFSPSDSGYLVCEEEYSRNIRNGISVNYFPDGTVAERLNFVDNVKQGEWIQYYPGGKIFLRSYYKNGLLNGTIEVWFENGPLEIAGNYKNNMRDGHWRFFEADGKLKYELDYIDGITKNRQMDIDISNLMDSLEKNSGKISDPEKSWEIL